MKTYQATSDFSGVYHERTGDFGRWVPGSADLAPSVDFTKNNTVPAHQVVYLSAITLNVNTYEVPVHSVNLASF